MTKMKIVADSSADTLKIKEVEFSVASLKINTSYTEYIDNESLDVEKMVDELSKYNGKSTTACPGPGDWLEAFGDAQYIFCVCITSGLSGSYNAACVAKETYESNNPGRHVFVIDSLSAGPELKLYIEKLREYILEGKAFEEICSAIAEYKQKTALLFMLESTKNLANNGRINPLVSKAVGLLGIRIVGKASDVGELEVMDKCRGEKKALNTIVSHMKKIGHKGGKVRIGHICNEGAAATLKDMIMAEFKNSQVEIYPSRGLCSFYAEKGGLMIGFES